MATVRQLTNGGYLVEISETELALIKTALEQTERVSRFGIEGWTAQTRPQTAGVCGAPRFAGKSKLSRREKHRSGRCTALWRGLSLPKRLRSCGMAPIRGMAHPATFRMWIVRKLL